MPNLLTKGQAIVGKLIGTIQAAAGSIGSSELATNAVTTIKVTDRNITPPKMAFTYDVLTNTTASTTTIAAGTRGGKLVTNVGTSLGVVISGAGISIPTAGDYYRFVVDATPGTTRQIEIKSTLASFNAAANKVIGLSEVGQYVSIEASSSIRWVVTQFSTGVTFAATT